MKNSLVLLFLFLSMAGCKESNQLPITDFDPEGMKNYTVVDVRTPEEFDAGHLENAVNINWYDVDFASQASQLDKENTIYVYCQKGGRSAKAAAMLDSLGYHVIDLTGGYGALAPPRD